MRSGVSRRRKRWLKRTICRVGLALQPPFGSMKSRCVGQSYVKSMNYEKCVIDFGPIASLKLGFCEQNVT